MANSLILSLWLLSFSTLPMTGSRQLGNGVSVVSLEPEVGPLSTLEDVVGSEEETDVSSGISNSTTPSISTSPCSLVTMSLLDGRDGKLMAYDDKTLITVKHDVFDVSQGIVPTVVYQGEFA